MRFKIVLAAALVLAFTGAASAQDADTISVSKAKAVTVMSGGKSIKVGTTMGSITGARLLDLDADGIQDVVISREWADGAGADLWLRRGDAFVKAGSVSHAGLNLGFEDVNGDKTVEVLSPAPTADGMFAMFADAAFVKSKGDELQLLKLDGDKYVSTKIECVADLGPRYAKAMDDLQAVMAKNTSGRATAYGKAQFMVTSMNAMIKSMDAWKKRFADGCAAP
jgi:hypothetical protein